MRRSLACDRSPENLARLAREVAAAYEAELANHFAIEEQVLFPLCPSLPMVAELLADHRALEGMVAQLRTTAAADLLVRFCGLLTSHIRREENELFQEIQRTLPDISLALTLVPCAQYENGRVVKVVYAAWVQPLPEGVDPASLPPPAGAALPGAVSYTHLDVYKRQVYAAGRARSP